MENVPEVILVRKLKEHSQAAFQELFNRYKEKVFFFACRYLINPSDSEEVVQEVFVRVWTRRRQINEALSFSNYLFTITKNIIFTNRQKQINQEAYRKYLQIFSTLQQINTEEEILFNECKELVEQAVSSLPLRRKEIYLLKKEKGLTHQEIAEKLTISTKTVETQITLALKEIRKKLSDYL